MSVLKNTLISLSLFASACTWAYAADSSEEASLRAKAMAGNAVAAPQAASAVPAGGESAAKLKAERDQLVTSLNAATTELAKLRAARAQAVVSATSDEQTQKLQQQLAKADAAVAQLTQQVKDLQSAAVGGADAVKQAQAEVANLKASAASAADMAALQAQVTSLTADRDLLRKQVGEAQDAARKDADLRSRLARMERDVELLTAQNQGLAAQVEKAKAAAPDESKKLADLTASVAQLTQDNAQLKQQLAAPAAVPAPDVVSDLKAQLAQAQDKLDTALRSYTLQQQDLDAARANAAKAATDADTKLSALQAENVSLKDQLTASTAAAREGEAALAAAQQEITSLRAAGITQGMQTTSLRDQLRQTQAQLAVFAEENMQLKTKLVVLEPQSSSNASAPARPGTVATQAAITLPASLSPASAEPAPPGASTAREHIVGPGDTLSKLSQRYYGTPTRWRRIYDANRDIIGNPNSLPMGAALRIP